MKRNTKKETQKQNDAEFIEALDALAQYSAIPLEALKEKIEQGVLKAVAKEYPDCDEFVEVDLDLATKKLAVNVRGTVVDDEPTYINEINIKDAVKYAPDCKVGDLISYPLDLKSFKRGSVSNAKQSIHSDVKEYEKERILAQYRDCLDSIITGEVVRITPDDPSRREFERGAVRLKLRGSELTLFKRDQIPGDSFEVGDMVPVYISEAVDKKTPGKKPPRIPVTITRTNREYLKRLFEREVPEIYSGDVVIHGIVREAGVRSKVAVYSKIGDIDPIGACIGPGNSRMNNILKDLSGEKIDLIPYSEDPVKFISSALAPAAVTRVLFLDENERSCTVYVPETQLSLAIGKSGINANLAVKLTGCRLDIKSDKEMPSEEEIEARLAEVEAIREEKKRIAAELAAQAEAERLADLEEETLDEGFEDDEADEAPAAESDTADEEPAETSQEDGE